MSCEIHVDDIGTTFILTVKDDGVVVDISGATTLEVVIRKPNSVSYSKTGLLYTDGTDGKIKYVSISGDLDQVGLHKIQAVVTIGSAVYHSSVSDFKVYKNIS